MEDDQVDIKIINIKQEIASNKAWIDQVSKSEAVHANTVIRLNQEFKEFKSLMEGKIECLEECEDLRDDQMKVLQTVITKLIAYIERDGYEWKVLDVPKAKK
jgi:type II secretory pathway predicted ATPase ExeA